MNGCLGSSSVPLNPGVIPSDGRMTSQLVFMTHLVQFVHCGADGAELVVGNAAHCEHAVQDASVVDLAMTDSAIRRRPRLPPPWPPFARSQTLMRKSPRSSWLRISCTIFRHSASGIMASYCPAMSKSCLETTQWHQFQICSLHCIFPAHLPTHCILHSLHCLAYSRHFFLFSLIIH